MNCICSLEFQRKRLHIYIFFKSSLLFFFLLITFFLFFSVLFNLSPFTWDSGPYLPPIRSMFCESPHWPGRCLAPPITPKYRPCSSETRGTRGTSCPQQTCGGSDQNIADVFCSQEHVEENGKLMRCNISCIMSLVYQWDLILFSVKGPLPSVKGSITLVTRSRLLCVSKSKYIMCIINK